jgi:cytochrome c oxidase assembly factor CtaG
MVQHMLLIFVVAPLLVRSGFPLALLWAIPRGSAKSVGYELNRTPRLWRVLTSPVSAWVLFALVFWVWHTSELYEAALEQDGLHILEHVLFLVSGMLFWWVLLQPTEQKYRRYGMLVLYLFTTMLQSGILGALMTFAPEPWYPFYTETTIRWGLTPLQDQQLAGLIMWIIEGAVLTLLTIGYFAAWLRALEQRSARLQTRDVLTRHHEIL